jgi:2-(1,2-epoxy-1,2-dihydrophenyl)acetyl-CoA isomerase
VTDYSTLLFDVRDNVARITLNRPNAANAVNLELAREMYDATLRAAENPDVRAVLLAGSGRIFCAGGDLKAFASHPPGELPTYLKQVTFYLHKALSQLMRMEAPLVGAISGNAGGAGMSLACACDLVLAGESARMVLAYTRAGLVPDGSSTYFLPRIVGLRRAMEIALTNPVLSAQRAHELGIVTRVVPDAELMAQAEALAKELAAGPTRAFGAVKRLLRESAVNSLEDQMELESEMIAEVGRTADAREGIAAFLGKRAPRFRGQ